jgi:hypothetical protein
VAVVVEVKPIAIEPTFEFFIAAALNTPPID